MSAHPSETTETATRGGTPDPTRTLLPVEVIEKILLELWSSPLSTDDRIASFTSLCLVNRTMLSIFIHIALRDVHITTPSFAQHYLRMLRTRASSETDDDYLLAAAAATANRLCRTITFHIAAPSPSSSGVAPGVRLYSEGNKEAEAVSNVLYIVNLVKTSVPGLRRVTVQYHNWGFDDVFDQCRLLPMPPQVTELALRYTFSRNLARVAHGLRRQYGLGAHHCMRWDMPQTKTIVVNGAPAAFVTALLETCPNVERLEVDDHVKLPLMKALPRTVRTLVLRTSAPPPKNRGADSWSLGKALKAHVLCTPPRELDITLESAGSNVRSREKLKKASESAGIRLYFQD